MDPVLSELLSRLGVDTDFGDAALTCPETRGAYEDTPLHVVAYYNDVALLSALMPFVTNIDVRGDLDLTPLTSAVAHGSVAAAAYLLWCGADPHARNELDRTPLEMMCQDPRFDDVVRMVDAADGTC
ncbi:hypothetical protein A7X84_15120 [Stenotrophomonas maltophilia]|uniref:ankyrin repeat domain-containing protein n=1 Tax=Stenotrophomonas TaxID=40323 RepID=UPI000DB7646C|nr:MULTISPECIES: ankyrin repeat domain-containing protein [Stenotrophomonas]MCV0218561.1 ankyrin repeat domain-containing protein [Stenotrophomonas sp. Ps181]PZS80277.1 hypothetical protein A7X84_15120 [Stenotrophomonas maltophilia]HDS1215536.1 ankyrin repeat domain-containing protein [Stenotrophomonas maltophilia]